MADGLLGAYFGNPNIQRQGARARALAKQRDVNLLADPKTYAVVQGLLGTPPDQLGFSVLNPKYQEIKQVAEPAFYAGSLLQVAPATAPAVNRIARAVGPRLEQTLLPAFEAAYNRGGLTREMVEAMGNQTVSPLTVYQGSPAKFNRLDATKIGSGEGAQSYGYGHYTAEAKPVAVDYQKRLAKENFTQDLNSKMALVDVNGKQLTEFNVDVNSDLIDAAKAGKQQFIDLADTKKARWEELSNDAEYPFKDYAKQKVASYTSLLDEAKKGGVDYTGSGFLYEMDLPDEQIAKMLDFDKPLMQQSDEIKALAKQYGLTDEDHMGGDLIAAMDAKRPAGAEAMRQSGIPGIRYLDQGSRGPSKIYNVGSPQANFGPYSPYQSLEEAERQLEVLRNYGVKDAEIKVQEMPQTSNFVVFPGNEDLLTILKRNGGLLD